MGAITAAELRAYLAFRRAPSSSRGDDGLSPRSLSQSLSSIRAFHRYLDHRLDTPNAAIGLVRGPRIKVGAPRPISEDQAHGLIAELSLDPDREDWEAARDEAVLTLLWGCGLRISEGLSLTRRDAPLADSLRITGKGGKTRIVPVLDIVRERIDAYLAALPFALGPTIRCSAPSAAGRCRRATSRPRCRTCAAAWACRTAPRRTPCATRSPPTCWGPARTCARSRTCWATPRCRPPSATRRWTPRVCWRPTARRIRGRSVLLPLEIPRLQLRQIDRSLGPAAGRAFPFLVRLTERVEMAVELVTR
jgi:hypothetical protein